VCCRVGHAISCMSVVCISLLCVSLQCVSLLCVSLQCVSLLCVSCACASCPACNHLFVYHLPSPPTRPQRGHCSHIQQVLPHSSGASLLGLICWGLFVLGKTLYSGVWENAWQQERGRGVTARERERCHSKVISEFVAHVRNEPCD